MGDTLPLRVDNVVFVLIVKLNWDLNWETEMGRVGNGTLMGEPK